MFLPSVTSFLKAFIYEMMVHGHPRPVIQDTYCMLNYITINSVVYAQRNVFPTILSGMCFQNV